MTKLPMRQPSKKREHKVMAKPEDFDAKKGKRMRFHDLDEDSNEHSLLFGPDLNRPARNDPGGNVDMSHNSGPSEHSRHSSQQNI